MRMQHSSWIVAIVLWLAGLLAAQAAPFGLTVRDNVGKPWSDELITWELTFPPGQLRGDEALVTRDGKPIPAQVVVQSRHQDGSVRAAEVLFVIDRLEKDGAARITAEPGRQGPNGADLKTEKRNGFLVLANGQTAVKLLDAAEAQKPENLSPILGVRTPSGRWTGAGQYQTTTARPVASKTELVERGPVRLAARVTTTFDNGRTHAVRVSLRTGSRAIDIDESFDVGPADRYQFKPYRNDQDELQWEWWSWYGDTDGTKEDHPNYWTLALGSEQFRPVNVRYHGTASTDSEKGSVAGRGASEYALKYARERRLEKYLVGHTQWRPDAVLWYAASPGDAQSDDVVAVFTHSVRDWRNPNVLPTPQGITLRTGANDMRIVSRSADKGLLIQCPIGLGRRTWAIRPSTVAESFAPCGDSPTALAAEIVQRNLGLQVTRGWVTDWPLSGGYPRLFLKPQEKEAYFARLKGKGVGLPGHPIDTFLRNQDQAGFDAFYSAAVKQADEMIAGYFRHGTDNTVAYPGWMLGYWHGIVVAAGLDNLAGHALCKPEQARLLRKKLAILTYCLTSRDAWPDKQVNYGWGSMNMPVGRWGGLAVMASALSDHPMAGEWLKDTGRYFRMILETEYAPDGTHISCPHYIGASSTSFYAWIALANSGKGQDVSGSPVLRNFARYYMQLMTPIDPRWGIRTLLTEGDSRPGSSPFPGILATLLKRSDPALAGQLVQAWIEGGRDVSQGMGVPDLLIIDEGIRPRALELGPEVFPGMGAILRYRQLGTPEEAYLTFLAGSFMIDHANTDQMAFSWHEKGVPLTLYQGDMYVPGAVTALSHNTLCWDVRPEGPPTPGKDRPGDWYHDNRLPWVEHANRPRLHLQIGFDQDRQKILDTRGRVTRAADLPGAALVEGRVDIHALAEVPTRSDYSIALQAQIAPPLVKLARPFTWTRRLLYVKDKTAAGLNYLVLRDDTGELAEHVPSFNYWSLSESVQLTGNAAHFQGQLGVDTDLFVAAPEQVRLRQDAFVHTQCEGIVASRGFKQEKQVLARVEGQKGRGFLVVIFPRKPDQPAPAIENWQGQRGVKVTWQAETHYVLLDTQEHAVDVDGIQAKASALVVKVKAPGNFAVVLPAGGRASYRGQSLESRDPAELAVLAGRATTEKGRQLVALSKR